MLRERLSPDIHLLQVIFCPTPTVHIRPTRRDRSPPNTPTHTAGPRRPRPGGSRDPGGRPTRDGVRHASTGGARRPPPATPLRPYGNTPRSPDRNDKATTTTKKGHLFASHHAHTTKKKLTAHGVSRPPARPLDGRTPRAHAVTENQVAGRPHHPWLTRISTTRQEQESRQPREEPPIPLDIDMHLISGEVFFLQIVLPLFPFSCA